MSNIIEYENTISVDNLGKFGVGLLDGTTHFAMPIQLPQHASPKMQVCSVKISDRIPNIYNAAPYYDWDNTIIRIATNVVGSQFDIRLERGLYLDVKDIAEAINATINTTVGLKWWANPLDPGIIFLANPVIDRIVITLDSTKLKPAFLDLTLDLRKASTGTDIATTLGFTQGTALMQTGPWPANPTLSFTSNTDVKMDAQGLDCVLQSSVVTGRRKNDRINRTLAVVTFAGKLTASDNTWPPGGVISPIMVYEGSRSITDFDLQIKTSDGRPMLFMSGDVNIVIAFVY